MHFRRQILGIVMIGIEASFECQAPKFIPYWKGDWEVKRQDVILYQRGWATEDYSALGLDNWSLKSQSHVTTLQLPSF